MTSTASRTSASTSLPQNSLSTTSNTNNSNNQQQQQQQRLVVPPQSSSHQSPSSSHRRTSSPTLPSPDVSPTNKQNPLGVFRGAPVILEPKQGILVPDQGGGGAGSNNSAGSSFLNSTTSLRSVMSSAVPSPQNQQQQQQQQQNAPSHGSAKTTTTAVATAGRGGGGAGTPTRMHSTVGGSSSVSSMSTLGSDPRQQSPSSSSPSSFPSSGSMRSGGRWGSDIVGNNNNNNNNKEERAEVPRRTVLQRRSSGKLLELELEATNQTSSGGESGVGSAMMHQARTNSDSDADHYAASRRHHHHHHQHHHPQHDNSSNNRSLQPQQQHRDDDDDHHHHHHHHAHHFRQQQEQSPPDQTNAQCAGAVIDDISNKLEFICSQPGGITTASGVKAAAAATGKTQEEIVAIIRPASRTTSLGSCSASSLGGGAGGGGGSSSPSPASRMMGSAAFARTGSLQSLFEKSDAMMTMMNGGGTVIHNAALTSSGIGAVASVGGSSASRTTTTTAAAATPTGIIIQPGRQQPRPNSLEEFVAQHSQHLYVNGKLVAPHLSSANTNASSQSLLGMSAGGAGEHSFLRSDSHSPRSIGGGVGDVGGGGGSLPSSPCGIKEGSNLSLFCNVFRTPKGEGCYQKLQKLGTGAFGETWIVRWLPYDSISPQTFSGSSNQSNNNKKVQQKRSSSAASDASTHSTVSDPLSEPRSHAGAGDGGDTAGGGVRAAYPSGPTLLSQEGLPVGGGSDHHPHHPGGQTTTGGEKEARARSSNRSNGQPSSSDKQQQQHQQQASDGRSSSTSSSHHFQLSSRVLMNATQAELADNTPSRAATPKASSMVPPSSSAHHMTTTTPRHQQQPQQDQQQQQQHENLNTVQGSGWKSTPSRFNRSTDSPRAAVIGVEGGGGAVNPNSLSGIVLPPPVMTSGGGGFPATSRQQLLHQRGGGGSSPAMRSSAISSLSPLHNSASSFHSGILPMVGSSSLLLSSSSLSLPSPTKAKAPSAVSALACTKNRIMLQDGQTFDSSTIFVCKIEQRSTVDRKNLIGAGPMAEQRILASCAHPCITAFIDEFETPEYQCLVMEYVDGGDLRGEVRKRLSSLSRQQTARYLSEESVLFLFVQICMALEYLHRHNILHRDLKTSNILFSKKWVVKLADFGFAKQFSHDVDMDVSDTGLGTPYYMAPETLRRHRYSSKADMWSAGVILYELITLERPYPAESINELKQMFDSDFVPEIERTDISPALRAIVSRLLDKNPETRASAKQILQTELMQGVMYNFVSTYRRAADYAKTPIDLVWAEVLEDHAALIVRGDQHSTSPKSAHSIRAQRSIEITMRQRRLSNQSFSSNSPTTASHLQQQQRGRGGGGHQVPENVSGLSRAALIARSALSCSSSSQSASCGQSTPERVVPGRRSSSPQQQQQQQSTNTTPIRAGVGVGGGGSTTPQQQERDGTHPPPPLIFPTQPSP